jgi:hypothetical protein
MEKITAIIATGTSPIQCFYRSIVSLLLHTDKDVFDQIIVSINGPDSRTGEPIYQDKKQQLCEDLAALGYPITVARAWSRVGFGQPYDMVTSLARTDVVLFMQDDIILKQNWMEEAFPSFFADPSVAVMTYKPMLANCLLANVWQYSEGMLRVDLPFMNNAFTLVRTNRISRPWHGHYCTIPPTDIEQKIDIEKFREFWTEEGNYSVLPGPGMTVDVEKKGKLSMDHSWKLYTLFTTGFGSWNYYDLYVHGDKFQFFSESVLEHYEGMSWSGEAMNETDIPTINLHEFRSKVKQNQNFEDLFVKYMPETSPMPDLSSIRPLVGVVVFERTFEIDKWLKAWNNANHYGAKIAVFHTYNGDEPDAEQKANILKHNPDFYIPVPNSKGDLGAFADLCSGKIKVDFDWNNLFWYTDDVLPIHKDFIYPMIFEMLKPGMGMTGGWYNDSNIRTVNFAISREAMERLDFSGFSDDRLAFVNSVERDLAKMVRDLGYMVGPMTFRYSAKYVWDCDHEGIVNLWHKYEAQFK